ncbi:MAG: asparagine synthase (glutamine-hydrolyzing), partial [Nitrososphaera sp.]|nr:asparagine synthase (glutamine-hydrolyzing) [Nitrososphaera sp.]
MNAEIGIALSHRRLSIIDLDPRSGQPMQNEDGTLQVTFNGEIYNYQSLREFLKTTGRHTLRTASDTEVLLHLYEEYGPEGLDTYLNKLRGMFAFGLWDGHRQKLLLARDPIGKKPLFYAETEDGFVFASTIRALLQDVNVSRQMNLAAIQLYLRLGYIPAPFTAFEGIHKLQAGHYLWVDATGIRQIQQYWAPDFEPKLPLAEPDLQSLIIEKLEEATCLRMISDVPLGVFLSGGIDSSAVVAMMSRLSSRPVKTFSVGFIGSPQDESVQARLVAQRFGCEHTELTVEIQPESLPELIHHYEEPFADAAAIPTYFMSKVARQHVTVVLNGDGGDEDFAGYTLKHLSYSWAESLWLPSFARKGVLALSNLLPAMESESSLPYRMSKSLRILGESNWRRNIALMEVFSPSDLMRWTGREGGSPDQESAFQSLQVLWQSARRFRGLDRELYFSLALHLPEQLLVKVDRASMAWSLEARSPLLDREFVEFCAKIPTGYKLKGRQSKYIFRQALRGIVPEEILVRGKQGFIP